MSVNYENALTALEDALERSLYVEGERTSSELVDDFAGRVFAGFVFGENAVLDALQKLRNQGLATSYYRRRGQDAETVWQASRGRKSFLGSNMD